MHSLPSSTEPVGGRRWGTVAEAPKDADDETEAELTDAAAADKGEKGKEKKAGAGAKDRKETPSKKARIGAAPAGPAVRGSSLAENPKPVKLPEQSDEVPRQC